MGGRERKYTLDTNLLIDASHDVAAEESLRRFHAAFAPFEYLSAVVVQELRAGVGPKDASFLQRDVFEPFERLGRVFAPSYAGWKAAGAALAELAAKDGLELSKVSKSFANDVLLAVACREHGVILVTRNVSDFERIARVVRFEFVPPWPTPST